MNRPNGDFIVNAERIDYNRYVALRFGFKLFGGDEKYSIAEPVVFQEIGEGLYTQPTITLKPEEAQQLMDELWQCGFRPTEGSGSAGSLAATERHLSDMRQIAFGLLKSQGVQEGSK